MAYNTEKKRVEDAIKADMSKYSSDTMNAISGSLTMEELTLSRENRIVKFTPPETWSKFDKEYQAIRVALNDFCKQIRIEIQTPAQADEVITEAIKDVVVEKVAEITQTAFETTTKFRGTWRYEVIDLAAVPRGLLMIDDKKVKEFIKTDKDSLKNGEIIAGIKFFVEESVTIR